MGCGGWADAHAKGFGDRPLFFDLLVVRDDPGQRLLLCQDGDGLPRREERVEHLLRVEPRKGMEGAYTASAARLRIQENIPEMCTIPLSNFMLRRCLMPQAGIRRVIMWTRLKKFSPYNDPRDDHD